MSCARTRINFESIAHACARKGPIATGCIKLPLRVPDDRLEDAADGRVAPTDTAGAQRMLNQMGFKAMLVASPHRVHRLPTVGRTGMRTCTYGEAN